MNNLHCAVSRYMTLLLLRAYNIDTESGAISGLQKYLVLRGWSAVSATPEEIRTAGLKALRRCIDSLRVSQKNKLSKDNGLDALEIEYLKVKGNRKQFAEEFYKEIKHG